eukprot:g25554.t1
MQVYKFSLPALDLMGLGRATSSINLFGAIRGAEDKYLEIGTFGNPQANIRFATGMDLALPVFSLNVTGELRIMKDGFSEKRSSATGWVAIEVQGEVPSLAGITLPEEVLRGAAREACRQTCAYASRKLEQELSEDFARWRAEKAKAAAALRKWALELFPNDGWVNYYQARFLDVDADRPQEAKRFYDTALKLLPNNPKVLTEVILFHDLALQHPTFSASLELSSHIAAIQKVPGQLLEDAAPEVDLAGLRCIAQQLLELSRERRLAAKVSVSWPRAAVAVLLALGALITWIPALSYNFNGGFFMDDAMIKNLCLSQP